MVAHLRRHAARPLQIGRVDGDEDRASHGLAGVSEGTAAGRGATGGTLTVRS
jgi:hypothetical protein